MKTLNELYTEIIASEELKAELLAQKTPEDIVAFAKKYGCDTTLDEIKTFSKEKWKASGELNEAELEQVAGGSATLDTVGSTLWSVLTLFLGCTWKQSIINSRDEFVSCEGKK